MRKVTVSIIVIVLLLSFLAGCNEKITPTHSPTITKALTPTLVPTATEAPTPALSPTTFIGTIDEEYRYRIEQLNTTDAKSAQNALTDLDATAKGQTDQIKELLISNFLAWFRKGSFPRRETSMTRLGGRTFLSYSSNLAELNGLLNDCALIAFQGQDPDDVYVLPAINLISEAAPNAMTSNSKLFFEKFKKLEEKSYLLWGRDGPGPEGGIIVEALVYWESYCEKISNDVDLWALPEVAGLPSVWSPEGMLRMLRMKLICNEQFGLPGAYMFRTYDNRLSETHRRFYRDYISSYPKTGTSEILRRYLTAMESGDWFKNDAAKTVLAKYGLGYSSEINRRDNPIYLMDLE